MNIRPETAPIQAMPTDHASASKKNIATREEYSQETPAIYKPDSAKRRRIDSQLNPTYKAPDKAMMEINPFAPKPGRKVLVTANFDAMTRNFTREMQGVCDSLSESLYFHPHNTELDETRISAQEDYSQVLRISKETAIRVNDIPVPANKISLLNEGGEEVHVATGCQYPTQEHLLEHIQMMYEQKPAVLGVLAEKEEFGEVNAIEYFKVSGNYGDFKVQAQPMFSLPTYGEQGKGPSHYPVECHMMTISKKGEKECVKIPCFQAKSWKDSSAALPTQLWPLVNLMKFLMQTHSDNPTHPPLVHCKSGVGRAGELIAAWILANHDVDSLQHVLRSMIVTRSKHMAYHPHQKYALCAIAHQMGIPIFHEDPDPVVIKSLQHLGYVGLDDAHYSTTWTALEEHKCEIITDTCEISADPDSQQAIIALLEDKPTDYDAIHISVYDDDDDNLKDMLWNSASKQREAIDQNTGEPFHGTPLEFWQKQVLAEKLPVAYVQRAVFRPSITAGKIGLLTGWTTEKSHSHMVRHSGKQTIEDLKNWSIEKIGNLLFANNPSRDNHVRYINLSELSSNEAIQRIIGGSATPMMIAYYDEDADEDRHAIFLNLASETKNNLYSKEITSQSFNYDGRDVSSHASLKGFIDDIMWHAGDTPENMHVAVLCLGSETIKQLDMQDVVKRNDGTLTLRAFRPSSQLESGTE